MLAVILNSPMRDALWEFDVDGATSDQRLRLMNDQSVRPATPLIRHSHSSFILVRY